MTNEGSDTASKLPPPTPPRRFGQLPDLAIPDDFDAPLPETEAEVWEAPDPPSQDDSGALDQEEVDDWPIDAADLRGALPESEADIAAGRTLSGEEIRARYGLPRSDTGGQSLP